MRTPATLTEQLAQLLEMERIFVLKLAWLDVEKRNPELLYQLHSLVLSTGREERAHGRRRYGFLGDRVG